MKVPFVDLRKQYLNLREEIDKEISEVLDSGQFILGDKVENFERKFAEYCGAKYCLGVNSGTSALHLALLGCQIENDEVITQPNTFFATAEAISYTGSKPVFVDVNPKNHCIDENEIKKAITDKTKCIIPVHLYGNSADMDKILEIAKKNNLFIIEDACQGHGAEYKGRKLGSIGDVGCFSFYPAKVLGCFGEAGAVITNNEEIYERMKALRDHGQVGKNNHNFLGYNYRMSGIQGAVLGVKIKYLDDFVQKRRRAAKLYNDGLRNVVSVLSDDKLESSNFQYYVIECEKRDELKDYLVENGVSTLIHYPVLIHLQEVFNDYREGDFPVAERLNKKILTLPMYPEIEEDQINYIINLIKNFYARTN